MTTRFELVTFEVENQPVAGLAVGDLVVPIAPALARPGYATMLGVLEDWANAEELLADAAAKLASEGPGTLPWTSLASVKLLAPVVYPKAVFGSGANYTDHMLEMAKTLGVPAADPRADDGYPWHFQKIPHNCIVGPHAEVKIPAYTKKLDWEVELAVIVSKRAKNVSVADAPEYVAGYTIANDLSARDHVKRDRVPAGTPFAFDWLSQKCFDGSCPLGPSIVPARFVKNPHALALKLWVNGELMQDSSSTHMIFDVYEQLAYLSSRTTLHPGDVILTGTPAGVGMARGRFLAPGDGVRLAIEGLGALEHTLA